MFIHNRFWNTFDIFYVYIVRKNCQSNSIEKWIYRKHTALALCHCSRQPNTTSKTLLSAGLYWAFCQNLQRKTQGMWGEVLQYSHCRYASASTANTKVVAHMKTNIDDVLTQNKFPNRQKKKGGGGQCCVTSYSSDSLFSSLWHLAW